MNSANEKLPRTADNVAIVPPMTLWDANGDSVEVDWVCIGTGPLSNEHHGEEMQRVGAFPDGTHCLAHEKRHGLFRWWMCYSTLEAARAAAAKQGRAEEFDARFKELAKQKSAPPSF
jgi:hypothetical protein